MLPIKYHIYMNQRLKNLLVYNKLVSNGLKCYGIKTDSLFVDASKEQLNEIFQFNNRIGGLKIEYDKELPEKKLETLNNSFMETKKDIQTFYIKSEKEFFVNKDAYESELKDIFKHTNHTIVLGTFPGVGKSWACSLAGKNVLYVTPFNELCLELIMKGYKSITLHNLMALNITGNSGKRKQFDVSEFDTIVFEEVLLLNPKLLSSIYNFIRLHPNKKIIANGDISQNLPIITNDLNNVSSKEKYMIECINSIFPNRIVLEVNKRLKEEQDRKILKHLKDDIFDLNKNVIDTFQKYNFNIIENINDLKTMRNISYFRSRSYKINKFVQDNLIDQPVDYITFDHDCNGKLYTFKYYCGQLIKCRTSFKRKNVRLCTNYIFEISEIDDKKNLTLENIVSKEKVTIEYQHLKYMSLPYSSTCFSCQGVTINEPFTIFDTNTAYADRRFIWTSITRSSYLKHITIFKHPENEVSCLDRCKLKQYFELKIRAYMEQDFMAGRIKKDEDIKDYVDYEWFQNQDQHCYLCNHIFDYELEDGHVNSNMSVDRLDNSLTHVKSNCKLCCVECNRAKSNRN